MEKWIILLGILACMSFLCGCLALMIIPGHPHHGVIDAMTFTAPALPAISVFSVITAWLSYHRKPNATLLAAIMSLSLWSVSLAIVNVIVYSYIFITNNYFSTVAQCILFFANVFTALGIVGLSCFFVNRHYKSLSGSSDYDTCSGWVRYYWADEYCCTGTDKHYGSIGHLQICISIVLMVGSIVGLFGENSVFPMLFIMAATCLFTSGILGMITSKLQLPDVAIWFLNFNRFAGCACWIACLCNVIFIIHASEYSRWNPTISLMIFIVTGISCMAGFFLSVAVEVLVGSRLGMHKYDPIKNGEPWEGYRAALKSREFGLCCWQLLTACILLAVTFLTVILLHASPFVLLSSFTAYLLIAASITVANIIKRKNVSIYSCYFILCTVCNFGLVMNFILSSHQLFIWQAPDNDNDAAHKSPVFLIINSINIAVSLLCLIPTMYSVYYYGKEIAKDDAIINQIADSSSETDLSKGLL